MNDRNRPVNDGMLLFIDKYQVIDDVPCEIID